MNRMFQSFVSKKKEYFLNEKLPALSIEQFLPEGKYQSMFNALQQIPMNCYDRYENPFERKYTLKKSEFPESVLLFIEAFESNDFLNVLKEYYPGKKICKDEYKHYWGVHKFGNQDMLALHADAGIHPMMNKPKFLTIGFYLNKEWNETIGANLELWEGDSLREETPELHKCSQEIKTKGNTLIMFECSEYGWHGAPNPYKGDIEKNPRYFVTLSLMLDEDPVNHHNQRKRAYFAKVANIIDSEEISKLRKLRADNNQYANIYRIKV